MSTVIYDAMVVGSGPSGSFAAKELTAQGLRVVLLEAGPPVGPADFIPRKGKSSDIKLLERAAASLSGQSVQARAVFYNSALRRLFVDDRKNPYTTPRDAPYLWIRGRQVGGRSHTFGRALLRWNDDDFKLRSKTGRGVDWPISYEEIVPYYEEVERTLGLYGQVDGVPTLPDSIYAHEAKLSPAETRFKLEVENKWPDRKVVSWRYIAPEPTRVFTPLRQAKESGNLEIRHNTVARRITVDERTGRATGAEVVDSLTCDITTVRAASVVLCASPIESIRLLLNSSTPKGGQGLANSSGVLGRYFMDQLPCIAVGTFPHTKGWSPMLETAPPDPFYGPTGGVFIPRFVGKEGAAEGSDFAFQGGIGRAPVGPNADARLLFFGFGLMMPDASNRVTLDPRRKDAWGIPVPHIRCKINDPDTLTLKQQVRTLMETIEGAGGVLNLIGSPLGRIEKGAGAYPDADMFSRFMFRTNFKRSMIMGAAIHECGGARMGNDPSTSVLNNLNQSWDVPNLFVTDASSFAGSGVTGTTLTIMALTVRACRHLAEELRRGKI